MDSHGTAGAAAPMKIHEYLPSFRMELTVPSSEWARAGQSRFLRATVVRYLLTYVPTKTAHGCFDH